MTTNYENTFFLNHQWQHTFFKAVVPFLGPRFQAFRVFLFDVRPFLDQLHDLVAHLKSVFGTLDGHLKTVDLPETVAVRQNYVVLNRHRGFPWVEIGEIQMQSVVLWAQKLNRSGKDNRRSNPRVREIHV